MRYRTLGKTGLQVSEIGFGAWPIGGAHPESRKGSTYGPTTDRQSLNALARAYDLGCNFIDTADAYGLGHSEELLGLFIEGKRDKIIIATKFGHYPFEDPALRRPTEKTIRHCLEASLRRLQADYVDIYQMHSYSTEDAVRCDVMAIFEKLKDEGKIRHGGACVYGTGHVEDIVGGKVGNAFETVQESYNPVALMHEGLIRLAGENDLGVIVREPLGNGLLTGRYDAQSTWHETDNRMRRNREQVLLRLEMAQRLKSLLVRPDRTLVQALLKFVLQTEGVSVVIPGCKTVEHVEMNMAAGDCPDLNEEEFAEIRRINQELEGKYGRIHPYAFD